MNRFLSSALTFSYFCVLGIVLSLHCEAVGVDRFVRELQRYFVILGIFLSVYGLVELCSWFVAPLARVLYAARSIAYIASPPPTFRLSGISLEPSYNAFAMLATVPWLIAQGFLGAPLFRKAVGVTLIVLCVFSGSRTAYVGLTAMLAFAITHWMSMRTRQFRRTILALPALLMVSMGIGIPVISFSHVGQGSSTSDVTRSYLAVKAFDAGIDRLSGQGFGQVGYYIRSSISPEIELSWELLAFFQGARIGDIPPVFSWYARTFGEFGPFGFFAIVFFIISYANRSIRSLQHVHGRESASFAFICSLLASQFFAVGMSIDSIRVPQYWIMFLCLAIARFMSQERRRLHQLGEFDGLIPTRAEADSRQ